MLDFISHAAAPFGLRLAPEKCRLIYSFDLGTLNKIL